jgi:hypothetical protein
MTCENGPLTTPMKERLHRLIDELPEENLADVERVLEELHARRTDPLLRFLYAAPLDDEPETEEVDQLQELYKRIESYLRGELPLEGLEDWLGDSVAVIAATQDSGAQALSGRVWRLISEFGYGHRSEESLRSELSGLLPVRHTETAG